MPLTVERDGKWKEETERKETIEGRRENKEKLGGKNSRAV